MPGKTSLPRSDEKARVAWLTATLRSAGTGTLPAACGIEVAAGAAAGDDCGVLRVNGPVDIVVGTDYVRGPKFRLYELGYLSNRDIARFCVTANISDIAAMGAAPLAYVSIVRYPSDLADEEFFEVMLGIDDACSEYGCVLLGGDTGSAERLILSGTAIGCVRRDRALLRSSAEPGDVVLVTDSVGGAGAAVLAADAGVVDSIPGQAWSSLLDRWTTHVAQPAAGLVLSDADSRIACQDVSDGLLATLRELSEQSRVGFVLDRDAIPRSVGVDDVAAVLGVDSTSLAMSASTDFCLCFTCPSDDVPTISSALAKIGVVATAIGVADDGSGVWFDDGERSRSAVRAVEWRHQEGGLARVIIEGLSLENGEDK